MRSARRSALLAALAAASLQVHALSQLDDGALSQVSGADGVGFAAHIALNDPALAGAVNDSRLSFGFTVDGQTNHIVIRNLRGTIDISPLNLDVHKKTDGGDYVALTLPESVRYGDFGFESLSVQADPNGPVTESLGRFNVNGTVNLRGQLRFWTR